MGINANELRQGSRREDERRLDERRYKSFVFGSIEWRQHIEKNYLLWPREDRRAIDRRSLERRNVARRQTLMKRKNSQAVVAKSSSRDILSQDEKTMLAGLFQSNSID